MGTRRGTIWSNLRWIHPQRSGYGTGAKALKSMLKYFQYRDDRDVKAPRGGRRWIDHGLGDKHRSILDSCKTLASDDRLAWTLMLSPKPRLMQLFENTQDRRTFVEDLTEDVIEHWMQARGYDAVEFAYVIHDRATNDEGLSQVHSHVILPGTVETVAGRERFDNRPSDLRQFNTLVEDLFAVHMDRELGVEWRVAWGAIQREDALKKHWEKMQWGDIPNDLPARAERLHAVGYSTDRIPERVNDPLAFDVWLSDLESGEVSLDAWFGG